LVFIHQDDDICVLDKPAGLLTVPGRAPEHKDSLLCRLQDHLGEVHVVHRLDMDTSGLLVFARHKGALRGLSRQFQRRIIEKDYLALLVGRLSPDSGRVDLPLRCDWERRPLQMVDPEQGKSAQTLYHLQKIITLRDGPALSQVLLKPITGRSHQLRVHMAALGYPILGDRFYAPPPYDTLVSRMMLHAARLELHHPLSDKKMTFLSQPDFDETIIS